MLEAIRVYHEHDIEPAMDELAERVTGHKANRGTVYRALNNLVALRVLKRTVYQGGRPNIYALITPGIANLLLEAHGHIRRERGRWLVVAEPSGDPQPELWDTDSAPSLPAPAAPQIEAQLPSAAPQIEAQPAPHGMERMNVKPMYMGPSRSRGSGKMFLGQITPADLADDQKVVKVYEKAIAQDKATRGDRDLHWFFAVAEYSLRKGHNPGAIFYAMIDKGNRDVDDAAEDAAAVRVKRFIHGVERRRHSEIDRTEECVHG